MKPNSRAVAVLICATSIASVALANVPNADAKAKPKCIVPAVAGLSLASAEAKLKSAHCSAGAVRVPSTTVVGKLVVAKTSPAAHTVHADDAAVHLILVDEPTPAAPNNLTTVGQTLADSDASGDVVQVTISSLGYPTADELGDPAPTGEQYVTVNETLTDSGATSVQDDADLDTAILGSDDQVYTSNIDSVPECNDFDYGEFSLSAANPTESGCVLFEIPAHVTVKRVQFGLFGSLDGDNVYFDNA